MKKFGTFGGVFTPTLLTILGVIMYLRLGWIVGNAGLLGAWLIITLAFLITLTTALSMSSITTNIRIGAGGAYAIISQSLGLVVGGSLGIPRYISQVLAVTMYIFGFREGWLAIFPFHSPILIDLCVFSILIIISYISANLAIKTQYIILVVIIASLISILIAGYSGSMVYDSLDVIKWGSFRGSSENNYSGSNFWIVFAVFFPAATGIMAGANMSGELENPKESIPRGTLLAIAVSYIIYMTLAYWIARSAGEDELIKNYNIIIDKAFWKPIVLLGVLGATFSSALASLVGSSRILFAMGEHKVLPYSNILATHSDNGQPRYALIITGAMIFSTMLIRELNSIAPLVTMFYLITYAMLNVVVIIEQMLGLISYRPIFKVPKWVPWIGLVSSVMVMFIINPTISLVSITIVLFFYMFLARQNLETPFEDVRSGLFVSFAEWATKHTHLNRDQQRAWKANLMVPMTDPQTVKGVFQFLKDIAQPKGSVKLLGINKTKDPKFKAGVKSLSDSFFNNGVFSSWSTIKTDNFADGVNYGNQALRGAYFKPNMVFLNYSQHENPKDDFLPIIKECIQLNVGVLLFANHPKTQFGEKKWINIWIRNRQGNWKVTWDIGNLDLSILTAYKLKLNWGAGLRLITIVDNDDEVEKAYNFMDELRSIARLPRTKVIVRKGEFMACIPEVPTADLQIFGLDENPNFEFVENIVTITGSSCLFVKDSGLESILA